MTSRSDPPAGGRRAANPGRRVDDLLARTAVVSIADLMASDVGGTQHAVSDMTFPELHEMGTEAAPEPASPEPGGREQELPHQADKLELEVAQRIAQARQEERIHARSAFEAELAEGVMQERSRVERLRLEFARDRQRFFAAAESQVVKLALAVAKKILARDAECEGLPLRASVKAALARVQDGSATILRVPEEDLAAWTAMFEDQTADRVTVIADERMQAGGCTLETNVGQVELGVEAQLEEVARGFGELMQVQGN